MIPIGETQAFWKCKWRYLVTILTKFQNHGQISESRPNFRISTKFQNLDHISESRPNFRISTKFQNLNQISESRLNFRISTKTSESHSSYRLDTLGPLYLWQCFSSNSINIKVIGIFWWARRLIWKMRMEFESSRAGCGEKYGNHLYSGMPSNSINISLAFYGCTTETTIPSIHKRYLTEERNRWWCLDMTMI